MGDKLPFGGRAGPRSQFAFPKGECLNPPTVTMKSQSSLSLVLGVSLLMTSFASLASAQEGAPRKLALRLLAVGDEPPYERKIENGIQIQIDPPAGSLPPARIALTNAKGGQMGQPMPLNLGQISRVLPVGPGKVPLHEVQNGALSPRAFHSLKMPRTAAGLAILWRDPTAKKWPKALSLTLPDDVTSFGAGKVRIVNISAASVRVSIQAKGKKKENFTLPRGKFLLRPGTSTVEIQAPVQKKWRRVYSAVPLQNKTSRSNLIIYNSDGAGRHPTKPIKVHPIIDRAVTPKVPKPRD